VEVAAIDSEPPSAGHESSSGRRRSGRTYVKYAVAVLATFGILGAVGNRAVDMAFSNAEERLHPERTVLVGVREDPSGGGDGFRVAVRSPAGLDPALSGVNECGALFGAAKRMGAVDVSAVKEALVLEGGTSRDLSIVDMRARIVRREPALRGALISCQSAGAVGAIGVLFDLDESRPVARKITQPESLQFGGPYFDHGNIFVLAKGEIQPFELVGVSKYDYVEWEVEADVIIDGKTQTITINDNGKPFRVSGPSPEATGYKRYYEWQWYKQPPQMWIAAQPSRS
jgi:hypothetical protein